MQYLIIYGSCINLLAGKEHLNFKGLETGDELRAPPLIPLLIMSCRQEVRLRTDPACFSVPTQFQSLSLSRPLQP